MPSTSSRPRSHRLGVLDCLRFVAALMVVFFHWFFNGIANGKVDSLEFSGFAPFAVYGFLGVNLFFIISGYVISESAVGKSAAAFAVGRATRLYPAFWAGMLLTTVVAMFWGAGTFDVTLPQFAANLTMVPQLLHQSPIDGVYWTLFVELTFYALVFVILFLRLGRWLNAFFPAWAIVMFGVSFLPGPASGLPFLGGYYLFFAAGAVMAVIRRDGWTPLRAVGLVAGVAGSLGFVLRTVPEGIASSPYDYDPIIGMLIVLCCFLLVASIWLPRVRRMRIPLSKTMSDLTYPVYLIHAHIGYMVLGAFATPSNAWAVYAVLAVVVGVVAWLLHWGVEVKLRGVWKRVFGALLERPIRFLQDLVGLGDAPGRAGSASASNLLDERLTASRR